MEKKLLKMAEHQSLIGAANEEEKERQRAAQKSVCITDPGRFSNESPTDPFFRQTNATMASPTSRTPMSRSHIDSVGAGEDSGHTKVRDKQRSVFRDGSMSARDKVDPDSLPYFNKVSEFRRDILVDVDHWGRTPLKEFSAKRAVAGDATCDTMEFESKLFPAMVEQDTAAWRSEVSAAEGGVAPMFQAAVQAFASQGYAIRGDIRDMIRDAVAAESDNYIRATQQLLHRVGLYALHEVACREHLNAIGNQDGALPTVSAANYALGFALQALGLEADAEPYLLKSSNGRMAAIAVQGHTEERVRRAVESGVQLGRSLRMQKRLTEATQVIERARDLCAQLEAEAADILMVRARSELGLTMAMGAGAYSAGDYLAPGVKFDVADPHTWATMSNNGEIANFLNDTATALKYYDVLAHAAAENLVPNHPEQLHAKTESAIFSANEAGLRDVITAWIQKYGELGIETLCAQHDLAVFNFRRGELQVARESFEKVYAGVQKSLGVYHRLTCDTASKVADTFLLENRAADAEWFMRSVHSAMEANFGSHGWDTRKATNNVACALFRRFQTSEAEEMWKRCVVPWAQELTPLTSTKDDVLCLLVLQNYCHLLSHMGRSPEVLEQYRKKIWTEWSRILGPEDPNTLIAMHFYGVCLRDLRRLEESKNILRTCWDIRKRVLGEEHPDTIEAEFNLAAALKISLDFTEAKELHDHAYEMRLRVLGPHHTDTSASEYYISLWYLAKRELEESEYYQRLCINGYHESYGPDHYWTLNSINTLGNILSGSDDDESNEAAGQCFEHAIEGLTKLFGEVHIETLRPLIKLAFHKKRIRAFNQAILLWKRVVENSEFLFGTYAPKTVFAVCNLIQTYNDAFKDEEGEPFYHWVKRGWDEVRKMPAADMDPKDFHCLTVIQESVERLPDKTPSFARRVTRRVTLTACKKVDSALNFLGFNI